VASQERRVKNRHFATEDYQISRNHEIKLRQVEAFYLLIARFNFRDGLWAMALIP
jgi:hypothetical protein